MSILKSMRSLYSEFSGQSNVSADILSLFLTDTASADLQGSVTDSLTNTILNIDYGADSEDVFLQIIQGSTPLTQELHFDLREGGYTMEEAINITCEQAGMDSQGLCFEKFLTNLNANCDLNTTLAEITQSFTTGVNQQANILIQLVQSKTMISDEDKAKLTSMISSLERDGKISQYAWLSIVKNVFGDTKDKAQAASALTPVTGSPYVLNGVWQLVRKIISTTINIVLDALILICSGILRLAAILIKAAFTAISSLASTSLSINDDDNTDYVKGSNLIVARTYSSDVNITYALAHNEYYQNKQNAIVSYAPGMDTYFWATDKGFIVNGRLCLNVHPNRLKTYLLNRSRVTYTHGNTQFELDISRPFWPINFTSDSENFFLTDDESVSLKYDTDFADSVMMASIAAIGLCYFQKTGTVQFKTIDFSASNITVYDHAALCANYAQWIDPMSVKNSNSINLYKKLWEAMLGYSNHTFIGDWDDDYTVSVTTTDPLGAFFSTNEQYGYEMPSEIIQCLIGGVARWNVQLSKYEFFFNTATSAGLEHDIVDSIPDGYGFTPAQFNVEQIVAAVTTVALIATAAFLAGKVITRAIANKTRIAALRRTQQINALRQQYIDNPTKANAQALNKAVNRYNLIGGIFGWDTYDLTNNWYNPRNVVSSLEHANLISGMNLSDTTDDKLATLINDVKADVSEIKSLII